MIKFLFLTIQKVDDIYAKDILIIPRDNSFMNVKLRLYINVMVLIVTLISSIALVYFGEHLQAVFPAIVVIISLVNIRKYIKMRKENEL